MRKFGNLVPPTIDQKFLKNLQEPKTKTILHQNHQIYKQRKPKPLNSNAARVLVTSN